MINAEKGFPSAKHFDRIYVPRGLTPGISAVIRCLLLSPPNIIHLWKGSSHNIQTLFRDNIIVYLQQWNKKNLYNKMNSLSSLLIHCTFISFWLRRKFIPYVSCLGTQHIYLEWKRIINVKTNRHKNRCFFKHLCPLPKHIKTLTWISIGIIY